MTGSIAEVKQKVETEQAQNNNYGDPTQTLPEAPLPMCIDPNTCTNCSDCKDLESWWTRFRTTVDDLVLRSDVHSCTRNKSTNEKGQTYMH